MADIDGLPETSQKPEVAYHHPLIKGEPGHRDGHNAGQGVNLTAAIAVKQLIQKYNFAGHPAAVSRGCPGVARQ